ncbi:hypothetical protein [Sphingomonas baiyangensis]|uniref:DUF4350 domain-containing protein n=1 Tax=Sphingomonas baiyangensis TaxID=2572576 RepID=A0A4U1L855_9SPHN|nr:hypothetical protein [Sphingomonas baiyangensis]TKD53129.1 hypothetical protein FBR43_01980 [Sphingomonas baiyangensis]
MSATAENPAAFGARAGIALAIAGAALLIAFLLMAGFGDLVEQRLAPAPGPVAAGASGFQALHDIAARTPPLRARIARDRAALVSDALLVLTPTHTTRPIDIGEIVRLRDGRPTLIILPKWSVRRIEGVATREERQRMVDAARWQAGGLLEQVAEVEFRVHEAGAYRPTGEAWLPDFAPIEQPSTIVGEAIEPLADIAGKGAIVAQVKDSATWIIADPDIANNHAMRDARNALAMMVLLRRLSADAGGAVLFDLTLHYRPGERNLVRLLFTPPFVAVTVALLAAALLAGWANAARFGPVRREARALPFGKAALIDTIAALTRAAGKAGAGGPRAAMVATERVARRLRAPAHLKDAALIAWIDARRPGFAALRARLADATHETEMVAAARALHDWRQEHA